LSMPPAGRFAMALGVIESWTHSSGPASVAGGGSTIDLYGRGIARERKAAFDGCGRLGSHARPGDIPSVRQGSGEHRGRLDADDKRRAPLSQADTLGAAPLHRLRRAVSTRLSLVVLGVDSRRPADRWCCVGPPTRGSSTSHDVRSAASGLLTAGSPRYKSVTGRGGSWYRPASL